MSERAWELEKWLNEAARIAWSDRKLTTSVTGTVTEQTGAVVVNAEILMLNLASGRQLTTKTDSSGKYELTGLTLDPYQISVNSEGFAAAAQSISLLEELK
jgi:hypothetical protein